MAAGARLRVGRILFLLAGAASSTPPGAGVGGSVLGAVVGRCSCSPVVCCFEAVLGVAIFEHS